MIKIISTSSVITSASATSQGGTSNNSGSNNINTIALTTTNPNHNKETWIYKYNGGKTVLDLNDDVMFEILKNIINLRELLRLKSVCKRFDSVVTKYANFCPTKICNPRHLYYTSEFRKMGDPRIHKLEINLPHLLANCKRLTHLNALVFTNFVQWDVSRLPDETYPSLVNLEIRSSHPNLSNQKFQDLLHRFINLEKMILWDLTRFTMDFTSLASTHLTCLEFKNHGSDKAFLGLLRAKGSQIKHLRIENAKYNSNHQTRVDKINESNLNRIIEYCPHLESLTIINYAMLGNLKVLLGLKNFKELVIDANRVDHRFSRDAYLRILVNNPCLTHLTIPVPLDLADFVDFVRTCATQNPKIQYLDGLTSRLFVYDTETIASILQIWAKFDNLCELNKYTKDKFTAAYSNLDDSTLEED